MNDPVSAIGIASLGPAASQLSGKPAGPAASADGGDAFMTVLGDMVSGVNHDLKQAEALSIKAVKGEAEVHEVVGSLMSAEQSLRMAVAIRDKIVSAYLDLSRMQI